MLKRYSTVSDISETDASSSRRDFDSVSVASNRRRYKGHKRLSSDLSEPLTTAGTSVVDESLGSEAGDPYFVFRNDLQRKLELVDESLAEFLRIVHETDTAVNVHEFKDAKKQLKRHIKNSESTLKDVSITVQAVENDRNKFSHIDDSQLFDRKALVDTSRGRIQHAKDELNSESVKNKQLHDERNKAVRRSGDGLLGATNDEERQNTSFIMDNQAQTSLLIQEQDETLDELGEVVARVGEMAGAISEEIGHQNKMLDELDEDMTNVEEELGMVMGNLAKLLKTKNKGQLRTIVCLSLTVVVLFVLVLYF
ncbi:syntaxin [Nitzschia inconspicua]|uniref:Syntaxin n=1 Tax=Nitzschia inconspicua TaxID=303405 RepID=A0A9K3KNL7_9STRA|nr:syntaxin [Nitzschia inconspicua]